MTRSVRLLVALIAAVTCKSGLAQAPQSGTSPIPSAAKPRQLTIKNKPWTGDFDKMLERRVSLFQ
jgi:hypothetical protein